MLKQNLNGSWTYKRLGGKEKGTARVPSDIYRDLLDNDQIPDPYYRDNELELKWIGENGWVYSRDFSIDKTFLENDQVILKCHGLDTLATITLNGDVLATTDNMYRTWEWNVKEMLKAGKNTISICFDSAMKYCREKGQERKLPAWPAYDRNWIRKEQCNFDWDWGPYAVTCGIWRDIELISFDEARLEDVHILQAHAKNSVGLTVNLGVDKIGNNSCSAAVTVSLNDTVVGQADTTFRGRKGSVEITIGNPKLWWPNNLGTQPLYEVEVRLFSKSGVWMDCCTKRIGLRTLELDRHEDEWGESFQFVVNGHPFFAKGANWIPADAIQSRMTEKEYRMLIQASAEANMNMLRVWGGGIYEEDIFYNLCDELGICVWQDFMFACATYPTFDKDYMATVKAELKDNIKRLRHHPSIALWCGNNEMEQGLVRDTWTKHAMSWKDYGKLFDKLMPQLTGKLDPQRDYWPGSPHSPKGDRQDFNNPTCGDAHLWDVWHGKKPFEWYRTCEHRFNSEFGFQSFPVPKTVYGYTEEADRNVTSWVMEHHQRSGIGNTTIMQYMLDWFRLPYGFENTLWASQILQGMAIKYACEHWRRSMPRGMGTLYWQLNDCWPVASWASIDYHGRWKALHYLAKDFFAPLLINGLEDAKTGTVEVHVTNDHLKARKVKAAWRVTDVAGNLISEGGKKVNAKASADFLVKTLDLSKSIAKYGARNLLVWLELTVDGEAEPVSRNLVLFSRPKHLELLDAKIKTSVKKAGDAYKVTLTSAAPALWTWLEMTEVDAVYSTNFVHVHQGQPVEILVQPNIELTSNKFKEQMVVKSLIDTY